MHRQPVPQTCIGVRLMHFDTACCDFLRLECVSSDWCGEGKRSFLSSAFLYKQCHMNACLRARGPFVSCTAAQHACQATVCVTRK